MEHSVLLMLYLITTSGLPYFYPAFTLLSLDGTYQLILPRFYPILEGRMCRGEKEGKNGVNSFYPRVKRG